MKRTSMPPWFWRMPEDAAHVVSVASLIQERSKWRFSAGAAGCSVPCGVFFASRERHIHGRCVTAPSVPAVAPTTRSMVETTLREERPAEESMMVPKLDRLRYNGGAKKHKRHMSPADKKNVKALRANGCAYRSIAEKTGVPLKVVWSVCRDTVKGDHNLMESLFGERVKGTTMTVQNALRRIRTQKRA